MTVAVWTIWFIAYVRFAPGPGLPTETTFRLIDDSTSKGETTRRRRLDQPEQPASTYG